jgi:hypothetical protein
MRKSMLIILGGLLLSTPALAKGKKKDKGVAAKKSGVRVKMTQNLFDISNDWGVANGEEGDKTKTQTISLLEGSPVGTGRTEITYKLKNGFELGGIVGLSNSDVDFDGDDVSKAMTYTAGLTGAYNFDLGDYDAFIQPIVGIANQSFEPDGGDKEEAKTMFFGATGGVRVKLFNRVTVDPQLEYLKMKATYEVDGDVAEDTDGDPIEGHRSSMGLRFGLTVML